MADSNANSESTQEPTQNGNGVTPIAQVKTQKECTPAHIPILTTDSGERGQEGRQSCQIRGEER